MSGVHLFTLAGIPIYATLGFALLIAYYGYSAFQSSASALAIGGIALGLVLSVLIHELGHALVARRYKLAPKIELRFFGGACYHEYARKDSHDALIIAAGPILQISVGAIMYFATKSFMPGWRLESATGFFIPNFVSTFVDISIYYGFANLILPIYPLDGGQLFRLGMLRLIRPASLAERVVHIVGLIGGIGVLVYALTGVRQPFLAILAGYAVIENFRWMSQGSPAPIRVRSEVADKLIELANAAVKAGDWHEARRLAFQAREEATVTDDQLARVFTIITVASAELKDWTEALGYSARAPKTPHVFVARMKALIGLGKLDQAREELDASKADAGTRAALSRLIEGAAAPS